jgi:hypothetical protein
LRSRRRLEAPLTQRQHCSAGAIRFVYLIWHFTSIRNREDVIVPAVSANIC